MRSRDLLTRSICPTGMMRKCTSWRDFRQERRGRSGQEVKVQASAMITSHGSIVPARHSIDAQSGFRALFPLPLALKTLSTTHKPIGMERSMYGPRKALGTAYSAAIESRNI